MGRRAIDGPLDLQSKDPFKILHQKLARMVHHDVKFVNSKIESEKSVSNSGLKVLPDTDSIHAKLFSKMEAGDGPKASGTEAFNSLRSKVSKRKLIVTDN